MTGLSAVDLGDPETLRAALVGLGLVVAAVVLGRMLRRPRAATPPDLDRLAAGQQQLLGALTQVAEAQARAQARLTSGLEARLSAGETRAAHSLGALEARIGTIDAAQSRIERLSGEMLRLQDILANKQARGAFGEIQLREILRRALPPDAYRLEATLSNGRRVDCLIDLPDPPGPLPVDSKFPLESYEALMAATDDVARRRAATAFARAVRTHIRDIAERYVIPGETAEGAVMFLPSEAIHGKIHARFPEIVREGFERRVWIVAPTTLMAVLTTLLGVMRDHRIRAESARIRRELGLLGRDLDRIGERLAVLDRALAQAGEAAEGLSRASTRAGKRAARLEKLDFSGDDGEMPDRRTGS